MTWTKVGTPPRLAAAWQQMFGEDCPVPPPVIWNDGTLEALVGREPVGPNQSALEDLRWHISIRGPGRVPTWEEMVEACHALRPGVMFCVPMPPRSFWLNVHESVLHVWEVRDDNLTRQWRAEASGHRPT